MAENKDLEAAAHRDFEPAPPRDGGDLVAVSSADRASTGSYFGWFIGVVAVLGLVLFAAGFFASQTRDQANHPGIKKTPATTGQGAR